MKKSTSLLLTLAALVSVPVAAVACGHEHNFDTTKSDDTNHWLECSCGEKKDEAAHQFTAIRNDESEHWYVCACGKEKPDSHEKHADADGDEKCDVCDADVLAESFFKEEQLGIYIYKSHADAQYYYALKLNADGTGEHATVSDTEYLIGGDIACEKITDGDYTYKFTADGIVYKFYFAENGNLKVASGEDPEVEYVKSPDYTMPEPARELVTGKYEGSYQTKFGTVEVAFSIYESLDKGYYSDSNGTSIEGMISMGTFENRMEGFAVNVVATADGITMTIFGGPTFDLVKTGPAEVYDEPVFEGTTYIGYIEQMELDVTWIINDDWTQAEYTEADAYGWEDTMVFDLVENEGVYSYDDGGMYSGTIIKNAGSITVNDDGAGEYTCAEVPDRPYTAGTYKGTIHYDIIDTDATVALTVNKDLMSGTFNDGTASVGSAVTFNWSDDLKRIVLMETGDCLYVNDDGTFRFVSTMWDDAECVLTKSEGGDEEPDEPEIPSVLNSYTAGTYVGTCQDYETFHTEKDELGNDVTVGDTFVTVKITLIINDDLQSGSISFEAAKMTEQL